MEWLVVTGEPRAQFRGMGVLNDETVCDFQVNAWDGSRDGADAFGIDVTACEDGADRYQLEPTELVGGNIRIHTHGRGPGN